MSSTPRFRCSVSIDKALLSETHTLTIRSLPEYNALPFHRFVGPHCGDDLYGANGSDVLRNLQAQSRARADAALSECAQLLMSPFWMLTRESIASKLKDAKGSVIETRKLWARKRPPDKMHIVGNRTGINSDVFASRDSSERDPDVAIRVHVPPILCIGDANFAHNTRGHAPTPNRRVSSTWEGSYIPRY